MFEYSMETLCQAERHPKNAPYMSRRVYRVWRSWCFFHIHTRSYGSVSKSGQNTFIMSKLCHMISILNCQMGTISIFWRSGVPSGIPEPTCSFRGLRLSIEATFLRNLMSRCTQRTRSAQAGEAGKPTTSLQRWTKQDVQYDTLDTMKYSEVAVVTVVACWFGIFLQVV